MVVFFVCLFWVFCFLNKRRGKSKNTGEAAWPGQEHLHPLCSSTSTFKGIRNAT